MSINEDIQRAIDKNLSSEVASRLKDFIFDAEQKAVELKAYIKENEAFKIELNVLRALETKKGELEQRERSLDHDEAKLDVEKQVLEVKEKCAQSRIDDIKELTRTVFGSNRLNYNLSLHQSDYNSTTGHNESRTTTGDITKET